MIRKLSGGAKPARKPILANPAKVQALAALQLPEAPKAADLDWYRYVTMIYGRQGVGKTTFGASFPDAILFSCERVSKAIEAFDFNAEAGGVRDWAVFRRGVELLEANPGRFATVIVDTIEAAYRACLRWVCDQRGIEHPHDVNDYGKTWDAITTEMGATLDRIWATGRGIVFTAHAQEVEFTAHSGEKFTRIQPHVSGPAMKYLRAKTDNILFAEWVRGADGNPLRILITEGDEVVEAKHAGGLPRFIPLPKEGGAALVARAFAGENVGLGVSAFKAGKETGKHAARLIAKEKTAEAMAALKRSAGAASGKAGRVMTRKFGPKA